MGPSDAGGGGGGGQEWVSGLRGRAILLVPKVSGQSVSGLPPIT